MYMWCLQCRASARGTEDCSLFACSSLQVLIHNPALITPPLNQHWATARYLMLTARNDRDDPRSNRNVHSTQDLCMLFANCTESGHPDAGICPDCISGERLWVWPYWVHNIFILLFQYIFLLDVLQGSAMLLTNAEGTLLTPTNWPILRTALEPATTMNSASGTLLKSPMTIASSMKTAFPSMTVTHAPLEKNRVLMATTVGKISCFKHPRKN